MTLLKNKYLQHKETIQNFGWRALQIGTKQGVTFLIFFMSAYFLSPKSFGMFSYLMALVGLFIIFCDFGISPATSKYVAEYKAKNSKKLNRILFSSSVAVVSLATLVSLFIIIFGKFIFKEYLLLLYFIPYLFLFPLTSVLDGVYRGLKDFKRLSIITLVVGPIPLIASYFLIKNYLLIGVIISQNLLFLLLLVPLFMLRTESEFKLDKDVLRRIWKYGLVIGLGEIGFFLYSNIDILILKQFGFIVEIGYYQIANKVFALVLLPFVILGQIIAPNITALSSNNKWEIIRKKYIKHLLIFFVVGVILAVLLYFLYPFILKTFLTKYSVKSSITIFNWLLLTFPFYVLARVLSNGYIISSGNAKYSLFMIPFGVLNIILDYLFIYLFGFIGVVYSTIICMTLNRITILSLMYLKIKSKG